MLHADRLAVATMFLPVVPGAHQRVLQDRQLIRIVADVVQETIHERLADLSARDADWTSHREASLVARHSRNQILSIVDRFRQSLKLSTVAEKVGTHREHDVDRQLTLLRRFE